MKPRFVRDSGAALVTVFLTAFLPWCYPTTSLAVEFANPVSYPVGTSPAAVVVADFNGDGKLDIAVANTGSGNVSVLLNNGDGTFKPAVNFDAGMAGPTSIEVADFNNDGIQDLAVWSGTSPGSSTLTVLLGNGDGTFQAAKPTPLPAAVDQATLDLVISDFNLDHKPDLAVLVHDANSGTSRILVLAGNADGTFQSPRQGSGVLSTDVGYIVAEDDFNNDGQPDLAVQVSGGFETLFGQGDGTFQAGPITPVGDIFQVAGDFNADGKVDVLATSVSQTRCPSPTICHGTLNFWHLSLFLGNGDGSFQWNKQLLAESHSFGWLAGHFNGDGELDVAYATSPAPAPVQVLLGRGDGTFSPPVPIDKFLLGASVVRDLNGDKFGDLIAIDSDNNAVVVALNASPGSGPELKTFTGSGDPGGGGGGGAVTLIDLCGMLLSGLWRAFRGLSTRRL
jgi:hypothetical protein